MYFAYIGRQSERIFRQVAVREWQSPAFIEHKPARLRGRFSNERSHHALICPSFGAVL
jgi:hypothetical protein